MIDGPSHLETENTTSSPLDVDFHEVSLVAPTATFALPLDFVVVQFVHWVR